MKFDQLSYFLEVAKLRHLGKAAKALAISPSAISHSIKKLEDELGRELFELKGKHLVLTAHGALLAERAKKLLEDAETLKEDFQSDNVELAGSYRLAATHYLCSRYLVPAWATLIQHNKALQSEITSLRSSQVVTGVAAREFDFGLCFSPHAHPDLEVSHLVQGQLLVGVRKDHPVLKKKGKTKWVDSISTYPAFLPKAFQGIESCETHPVFSQFKISPNVRSLIDSYDTAVELVLASEGWGLFPDIIRSSNQNLTLLQPPANWQAPYTVSIVRSRHRFLPSPLRQLRSELEKSLK